MREKRATPVVAASPGFLFLVRARRRYRPVPAPQQQNKLRACLGMAPGLMGAPRPRAEASNGKTFVPLGSFQMPRPCTVGAKHKNRPSGTSLLCHGQTGPTSPRARADNQLSRAQPHVKKYPGRCDSFSREHTRGGITSATDARVSQFLIGDCRIRGFQHPGSPHGPGKRAPNGSLAARTSGRAQYLQGASGPLGAF